MGRGLGLGIQGREAAAVAIGALSRHAGVIHPGRPEGVEVGMTTVALGTGWNVPGPLADCTDTVVTSRTATVYGGYRRRVIERCRRPRRCRLVTGVAGSRCRDV
jgi:hypothetical protein